MAKPSPCLLVSIVNFCPHEDTSAVNVPPFGVMNLMKDRKIRNNSQHRY